MSYPAVSLFVERAQAIEPDFALTPENAQAVAAICERLEGLPLAIELAAARINLLSPSEIEAYLRESRLKVLSSEARHLPGEIAECLMECVRIHRQFLPRQFFQLSVG